MDHRLYSRVPGVRVLGGRRLGETAQSWGSAGLTVDQLRSGITAIAAGDASGMLGAGLQGARVVFRTAVTPEISIDLGSLLAGGEQQAASSDASKPALPFLRPEVELEQHGNTLARWSPYGSPPAWFWPATLALAGVGALSATWTLWRAFSPRSAERRVSRRRRT